MSNNIIKSFGTVLRKSDKVNEQAKLSKAITHTSHTKYQKKWN